MEAGLLLSTHGEICSLHVDLRSDLLSHGSLVVKLLGL